jgi:hypothetical protein
MNINQLKTGTDKEKKRGDEESRPKG